MKILNFPLPFRFVMSSLGMTFANPKKMKRLNFSLPFGGVWYTGIGSGNRYLIHFLLYSYIWINVKNIEME